MTKTYPKNRQNTTPSPQTSHDRDNPRTLHRMKARNTDQETASYKIGNKHTYVHTHTHTHTLNPDPHTHTHRSTPLPLLLAPLVPSMLAHAPTLVHSFIAHSSSTTAPVFHHFPARISYCAFALTDGIRCGSWRGLDCTRLIDILTRLRIAQCQWRFCGSCVCV